MRDSRHHLRGMRDCEREAADLVTLPEPPTGELAYLRKRIEGHALRAIVATLDELDELHECAMEASHG